MPDYRIDFFQLTHTATANIPTVRRGFELLQNGDVETSGEINRYTREVWRPRERRRPQSHVGQFRKFRMDDWPEVGRVGQPGHELELENAGLIEKNFFVYYPDRSLLGWHTNAHASGVGQFARFLSQVWGTKVYAVPVLQPEAARRLLRGNIDLKRFVVSIPRPRAPDLYPDDDFGRATLELLNHADGDLLHLSISIDGRRGDARPHLARRIKRALAEFANFGATTAKAIVYEDGIEHPIDLLADRVTSHQTVEHDGRYAPEDTMFHTIDAARTESEGPLREYFGQLGDALD